MPTRKLLSVKHALLGVAAAALCSSAMAVKYGELDGERHPYVGIMVAQDADGNPLWRCSGTLISASVFLTAGHCTYGAIRAQIWFASDVQSGIPGNGYPYIGEVAGYTGTHPDYDPNAFFYRDLGVVVLDAPHPTITEFGLLPTAGQLNDLKTRRGKQDTTFTAVGYGLQYINPVFVESERVRMFARPHLIAINVPGFTGDFSMLLSNNHSTGGTCFGDSGGPNFIGESRVIGGVTSFGINGNCAGTGGVYRLDRQGDLDLLEELLSYYP